MSSAMGIPLGRTGDRESCWDELGSQREELQEQFREIPPFPATPGPGDQQGQTSCWRPRRAPGHDFGAKTGIFRFFPAEGPGCASSHLLFRKEIKEIIF